MLWKSMRKRQATNILQTTKSWRLRLTTFLTVSTMRDTCAKTTVGWNVTIDATMEGTQGVGGQTTKMGVMDLANSMTAEIFPGVVLGVVLEKFLEMLLETVRGMTQETVPGTVPQMVAVAIMDVVAETRGAFTATECIKGTEDIIDVERVFAMDI